MKRLLIIMLLCLLGALLSGCFSLGALRLRQINAWSDREGKAVDACTERLLRALNEDDAPGLQALFAKDTAAGQEDLDAGIDELLAAIHRPLTLIVCESGHGSGSIEHGVETREVEFTLRLSDGQAYYSCAVDLCYRSDADPGAVGVRRMVFETAANAHFRRWGQSDAPRVRETGLTLLLEDPEGWQGCFIDRSPAVCPELQAVIPRHSEADFAAFCEGRTALSREDLVARFGEPDYRTGERDFAYALPAEDGETRFLRVGAWLEGEVTSIYVTTEAEWLRKLWPEETADH